MEAFMKVDPTLVKHLREAKAWSQEHLAQVSGLSRMALTLFEPHDHTCELVVERRHEGPSTMDRVLGDAFAFGARDVRGDDRPSIGRSMRIAAGDHRPCRVPARSTLPRAAPCA